MDRVLVTGATGFVGSAVARKALERGFSVRVLARKGSDRRNLEGLDVEVAEGDLSDGASLRAALRGCQGLFNVAADYRLWAKDPSEIIRNNRIGTEQVMTAALDAGVGRIVHTSSVATLSLEGDGPSDETRPLKEGQAIGAYKESKVVSERIVERFVVERDLPAVIVQPSTPIGPRDIKPTPTGRIVVEAATGKIPAFVDTGLNLVHVDDVAEGHLLAYEKGRVGERYVLGGYDVPLKDMLAEIARQVGRKAPTTQLPTAPLYPLAVVMEAIGRITGKEPMLTVDALKMAGHRMFFSSAKAERELGYHARPWPEAIADALTWFRAEGYLG